MLHTIIVKIKWGGREHRRKDDPNSTHTHSTALHIQKNKKKNKKEGEEKKTKRRDDDDER